MTRDELEAWQENPITQLVIGEFTDSLETWENLVISPNSLTPEQFWQDGIKRELAVNVLDEFLGLLSDLDQLETLLEDSDEG